MNNNIFNNNLGDDPVTDPEEVIESLAVSVPAKQFSKGGNMHFFILLRSKLKSENKKT